MSENIKKVIRIKQSFNEFVSYNDVLLDYYHLKNIFDTNDVHWRSVTVNSYVVSN